LSDFTPWPNTCLISPPGPILVLREINLAAEHLAPSLAWPLDSILPEAENLAVEYGLPSGSLGPHHLKEVMALVSADVSNPFILARLDDDSKLVMGTGSDAAPVMEDGTEGVDGDEGSEDQIGSMGFDPGSLMGMGSAEEADEDEAEGDASASAADLSLATRAEVKDSISPKAGKEAIEIEELKPEEEDLVKEEYIPVEDAPIAEDEGASGFEEPDTFISMGGDDEVAVVMEQDAVAVAGEADASGSPQAGGPPALEGSTAGEIALAEEAAPSAAETEADGMMDPEAGHMADAEEGAPPFVEGAETAETMDSNAAVEVSHPTGPEDGGPEPGSGSEPLALALPPELEGTLVVPVLGPHKALQVWAGKGRGVDRTGQDRGPSSVRSCVCVRVLPY